MLGLCLGLLLLAWSASKMFGGQGAFEALAQLGNQYQGQSFSHFLNARAASKSWDKQKDWATRGPSYVMQGLRRAGINPILAAGGGISVGAARAPQASPSKPFAATGGLPGMQAKLMAEQTRAASALGDVNYNTADKIRAEADFQRMVTDKYANDETLLDAYIANQVAPNTLVGAGTRAGMIGRMSVRRMWQQHGPNFMPGLFPSMRDPRYRARIVDQYRSHGR